MPFGLGFFATAGVSAAGGTYELIASEILTGSQSSVTFSNLGNYSSTYKHLQIRAVGLFDITNSSIVGRINADSGTNYSYHRINGNGSGVFSGGAASKTNMVFHYNQDNNSTNQPGVAVIDFLDVYANKYRTIRSFGGTSSGASQNQVNLWSGLWMSSATLSSISLSVASGYDGWQSGNFRQYSRFSLYGVK